MKKSILFVSLFLNGMLLFAQTKDELALKEIYKSSLINAKCYPWLEHLSNTIGSRLSGSTGAEKAVLYTKAQLETLGLDKVYLQEVMVPKWVRGEKEVWYLQVGKQKMTFPICALGGSVATPKSGIKTSVIEVKSLEELTALGEAKVKGKIVFFNRPMNPEFVETFKAYSSCVDQRSSGAKEAGKLGALAVIVRSMNLRLDDLPHTGATNYGDVAIDQRIPAAAISTNGAELLSKSLKVNPTATFYLKQSCQTYDDVLSYNVVGELTGTEHPERIMVVGGHLDSWDLGDGSHDDGTGCVQSMEVLNIFKNIGYKPKNTIRVVLFMNEENGVRGGKEYENQSNKNKENHIFALESDAGGFTPRGFNLDMPTQKEQTVKEWAPLFYPYGVYDFKEKGSGSDVGPLKEIGTALAGLQTDSQRYFDLHHAETDVFESVSKRELDLGTLNMAALIWLVSEYGL